MGLRVDSYLAIYYFNLTITSLKFHIYYSYIIPSFWFDQVSSGKSIHHSYQQFEEIWFNKEVRCVDTTWINSETFTFPITNQCLYGTKWNNFRNEWKRTMKNGSVTKIMCEKKIWTKLAEISKMLTKPKRSGSIEMIMTIGIEKGIVQSLV